MDGQRDAPERGDRIRSVFLEALATDPGGRALFLDRACGSDAALRQEVERLLAASGDADEFLSDIARRAVVPLTDAVAAGGAWEPLAAGRRLGAYRVIRELGRGGMGAVYLAERADEQYEKLVAIKLLPLGLGGATAHERFLAERRVLAQLEHPGIARLIDAGVADEGTPYFIMEYVEGEAITGYCDGAGCSMGERLALFLQVCDAVEYAHRHHVVHRDLKPANILVTPEGRVKLLDFGIAKVLDGGRGGPSRLTRPGGTPLTPSHASPEQMTGGAIGVTSDVYQLGVLLYQLLAGRPPYCLAGRSSAEAVRVVLEEVPTAPSEAAQSTMPATSRAGCHGDLDAVVLKALRKEPERRYGSVAALARDVARSMDGAPVLTHDEPRPSHGWAWLPRPSRTVAGLAAALVIALAGVVTFASLARSSAGEGPSAFAPPDGPGQAGYGETSARSLGAYLFYQEGLRAHYAGRPTVARPLFRAAVREDSTFAMAWYYLGRSAATERELGAYVDLANRLAAEHGTDRERLLIGANWAALMSDPSLRGQAETLERRHPHDVDGQYLLGVASARGGDFLAAVGHFERVVALDSASFGQRGELCRGCDALERMVHAYVDADSLPAAERSARRWVRLHPGSGPAWHALAWTLWRQGRGEEALHARRESMERGTPTAEDQLYPAIVALRAGDYATADGLLAERQRNGTAEVRRLALFWQTISFRYQGRLREALGSARRHRALVDAEVEDPHVWQSVALEAHVLFELGRLAESAALIDSAAADPFSGLSATRDAQHVIWVLTHATTVAMAAGDTARVRMLADSMETLGRGSPFARNQRLHHYGRGMLSARRGDVQAAVASFRIATEPSYFSRAGLEFARLLIEHGRADEAAAVLHVVLRGPTVSGGFYTTRTELHELLGQAWDAAGRPDSAAVNYRKVVDAWQHADAQFAQRRDAIRLRLAALDP
jgi:serine/threonine protein kinase/tetratricopeptide (TPR) repeat protein